MAIAIANRPRLLLADEPTSALDVTVQKQVIDTMLDLRKQFGTAIVIVSHNMGVIAAMADKVGVMKRENWWNGEAGNRFSIIRSTLIHRS